MKIPKETPKKTRSRKLYTLLGIIVIVLIAGYLGRGWIRMTVVPKTISIVHGNPADKAAVDELAKLLDVTFFTELSISRYYN